MQGIFYTKPRKVHAVFRTTANLDEVKQWCKDHHVEFTDDPDETGGEFWVDTRENDNWTTLHVNNWIVIDVGNENISVVDERKFGQKYN